MKNLLKDNEFLETAKKNRKRNHQKGHSVELKTQYIDDLQGHNRKLRYQISKIKQMIEEQNEKPQIKKQYGIVLEERSSDVMKKQLQNAYKLIKHYENEIKVMENRQSGGLIIDKMSKLQIILKEKSDYLEKIKNQMSTLTKNSMQFVRRLKNNSGKEVMEGRMIKYNEEIKMLRQRIKIMENKTKKKNENAKKQYDFIKKLENHLIKSGMDQEQIEDLKLNKQMYLDTKLKKNVVEEEKKTDEAQKLAELKRQVKLFEKLQAQYEKKIQALQSQKRDQEEDSIYIEEKLQQKAEELEGLQAEIQQYRGKIDKVQIKPRYSYPKQKKKRKKQKPQMSPTVLKKPEAKIIQVLPIKYDEKGKPSQNGTRFTDRPLLGKTTNSRIVGVKVWTQKSTFSICGIQCIYKINDKKLVNGDEHISKEVKKQCAQNVMILKEGDYIRTVSGHLSNKNIINYLVFITRKSEIERFGIAKSSDKQFNFFIEEEEVPICLYGSIGHEKDPKSKKYRSVLENIGFQICRDINFKVDDKFI